MSAPALARLARYRTDVVAFLDDLPASTLVRRSGPRGSRRGREQNTPAGTLGLVAELVEDEIQMMADVETFLMGLDSQPAVA